MDLQNSDKIEHSSGNVMKQDKVASSDAQDSKASEPKKGTAKMADRLNENESTDNKLKHTTLAMEGLALDDKENIDAMDSGEGRTDTDANGHSNLQDNKTAGQEESGPKKKKKKKSNGKKPTKVKPSGFEDFYVDPPIAPAEHLEEQSLYAREKSFADRLLLAIARYTSRRRFSEFRLKIFDKYLAYGGLSTGIKQFQGGVDEKTSDMTALDIAIEKSKYHIDDETLDASVVDFDSVVRGFLSSYLHSIQEILPEDAKISTGVIRNFLNYLIYHNVCPEYADQIYDAKKSCDDADIQLPICSKLANILPGTFNQACSLIFGGFFQDTYIEDVEQSKAFKLDPGMRSEEAVKIFLAGLAAHGSQEMVEKYNKQTKDGSISITSKQSLYLEVVSIHPPSAEVLELYSLPSQKSVHPTGLIKFQTWRHPHDPWPEMKPSDSRLYKTTPYERSQYELYLDVDLLPLMLVGTKICCTYYETSFGLRYFDSIIGVLSPMFTWLDNEAMMDWIKPKEIPWKAKSGRTDNDGDVIATRTIHDGEDDEQEVKQGQAIVDDDEDADIPSEFKNYEKGEDIIVTL